MHAARFPTSAIVTFWIGNINEREILFSSAIECNAGAKILAEVHTVFNFLAVSWRLLQSLDDEGGSRWDDSDLGLTILDGQLHSDT